MTPITAWHPIETAPKDGTKVDLLSPYIWSDGICYERKQDCWYMEGNWWENSPDVDWSYENRKIQDKITHWMPIPEYPETLSV